MPDTQPANVMEQIVSLCKRRGFIYPASEIYGGIKGFWDYGPLGVLLKNNVRDWWWRQMVLTPPIGPDGHPVDMGGLVEDAGLKEVGARPCRQFRQDAQPPAEVGGPSNRRNGPCAESIRFLST